MNYAELKNEILTGPLAAELEPFVMSGSDAEIMRLLNDQRFTRVWSISRKAFSLWAAASGVRGAIQIHATNPASPLYSSALAMLDLLQGGGDDYLDLSNASVQGMLSAWVVAGAMTDGQHDELVALATIPASRADIIFGSAVDIIDVRRVLWSDDGVRAI